MNMTLISMLIIAFAATLVFVFDAQYVIFAATVVAFIPTILRFGKLSFMQYYKQEEQYKGALMFTHPLVCFIIFVFSAKLLGLT